MASNTELNAGSGGSKLVTKQVTHDGDTSFLQGVQLIGASGTEDSYTIGSIGHQEDAAHSSGDWGLMALGVRNDTLAALAGSDGDYAPLQVDASGALYVQLAGQASNLTVDLGSTDNAVLDVIAAGFAAEGAALSSGVLLQGDDGTDRTNVLVDTDGHLQVDVLSGGGGGTQYAEDAAHTTGDTGTLSLVVRNDTLAALAGTDGDYAPLQVDGSGALYIQEGSALDVSAATVTVDGSGVTQPVSGTVTANLSATDNAVLDNIQTAVEIIDNIVSGSEAQVDVVAALPAGSNLIGNVGLGVRTSGGTSTYYDADLDETAIAVKASAGNIYSIVAFNTTAAPLFLQLFDVAQGSVTVGTTTPTNQYVIPGNADSDGAGFVIPLSVPKSYSTAITVACSTNNEGNGAPGANACIVNIEYN